MGPKSITGHVLRNIKSQILKREHLNIDRVGGEEKFYAVLAPPVQTVTSWHC
jgi:hypothetical protein